MSDKRAALNLLDEEVQNHVSIEELASTKAHQKEMDIQAVKKISEQSGFISRESKMRRPRPSSPYLIQMNLKTRQGVKEIFQEVGARLGIFDQTTFENALLALLEKEKMFDLLRDMEGIIR